MQICIAVINLALIAGFTAAQLDIKCRNPNYYEPQHVNMTRRKFSVYSSPTAGGGGFGNVMVYWPISWVLAAVTGYDIVILDNSLIGKMCNVIECGHVMQSVVSQNYTYVSSPPKHLKLKDVLKIIEGKTVLDADVVFVDGFLSYHSVYVYTRRVRECLATITGCPVGDMLCMEHYAFMSLVKGPFKPHAAKALHDRVEGLPRYILHHILHDPISTLQRLDGAFQLRMQYEAMEIGVKRDKFKQFFSTNRGIKVIKESLNEMQSYLTNPKSTFVARPVKRNEIYIYLSCDDAVDKLIFADVLRERSLEIAKDLNGAVIIPVYVRNIANMSHTKSYSHMAVNKFENSATFYSFIDTIFDWYMLANSNIIWAYRDSTVVSTFAESASRVMDRDVCDYSTFSKIRVLNPKSKSGKYGNIWAPSHPSQGQILCQIPPQN